MIKLNYFVLVLVFILIGSFGNCQVKLQNVNGEDSIVYRSKVARAFYLNFLEGDCIARTRSTIYDNYPIKQKENIYQTDEIGQVSIRVKFKVSIETLRGKPELKFIDTLHHNWELIERIRPGQTGDSCSVFPMGKVYVAKSSYKKVIVCFELNNKYYMANIKLNGSRKTVSKMYDLEYIPARYFSLFLSFLDVDFIDSELLYEKQYYFSRV